MSRKNDKVWSRSSTEAAAWKRWCLDAEALLAAVLDAVQAPELDSQHADRFAYVVVGEDGRMVRVGGDSRVAAALINLGSDAIFASDGNLPIPPERPRDVD